MIMLFQNCSSKQPGTLTIAYQCEGSFVSKAQALTGDHRVSPDAIQEFFFKGTCGNSVRAIQIYEPDGVTLFDQLTCENSEVSKQLILKDQLFWGQSGTELHLYTKLVLEEVDPSATTVETSCQRNALYPVSIDNLVPQLSIDKPVGDYDNAVTGGTNTLFVSGYCDENNRDVSIEITASGIGKLSADVVCVDHHYENLFADTAFKIEDKVYNIKVVQFDDVHNKGQAEFNFNPIYYADDTPPTDPNPVTLGPVPNSLKRTPTISWGAASDPDPNSSGIDFYEVEIMDSSGNVIAAWRISTSGLAILPVNLVQGASYKAIVRAVDKAGNRSPGKSSSYWVANFVQPRASHIATGARHSCAWHSDEEGNIWCWGDNSKKQISAASANTFTTATKVFLPTAANEMALGEEHSCILNSSTGIFCWGSNSAGQIGRALDPGITPKVDITTATSGILAGASSLVAGANFNCAIKAPDIWCWGDNSGGKLGVENNATQVTSPSRVNGFAVTSGSLTAGKDHLCFTGLKAGSSSTETYCWGVNDMGQVGTGSSASVVISPSKVSAAGVSYFKKVSGGGQHTCATSDANELWCWGSNSYQQLGVANTGDGAILKSIVPIKAALGNSSASFDDFESGFDGTCFVYYGSNVSIKCVGNNIYAQLGFPSSTATSEANDPKNYGLGSIHDITDRSFGKWQHSCLLLPTNNQGDQEVVCSGFNTSSQCGGTAATSADKYIMVLPYP
jgi:alpha-tubulin suppressor-like RCC1 family protein